MLQAADPVAREVLYMPELATICAIPAGSDGAHGGIKDRFPRLGKNDRVRFGCHLNHVGRR
jgi:hypothetical protein